MALTASTVSKWGGSTVSTDPDEAALFERVLAAVVEVIARDYVISNPMTAAQEQAVMIKVAKLWRRRDSIDGVASFNDFGVIRVSQYEDPDVVMLLEKRWAFA